MFNFCCQSALKKLIKKNKNIKKAAPNAANFPGKGFISPQHCVSRDRNSLCATRSCCSCEIWEPGASHCSPVGLENRIPRKRAEAAASCMLISTKHMPGIQCIRHAAASEKLEHLEHFGAAFLHISYLLLNTARAAAPLL